MNETTSPQILVHHVDKIAVITIDNIKRRNAMGRSMRQSFREAVRAALADSADCRALVIAGAGGNFSAGADISELGQRTIAASREILAESCVAIRDLVAGQKPVVAAVEGIAFGAGLSIVCAADFVVAACNARFCAAFMRVGLIPDTGILWTLPKKVGPAKARELMALASEFDAAEALRIGLVSRVVEAGQALTSAIALAAELAQNPPMGMALTKAALGHGSQTMDCALHTEIDYQALLRGSADHQEAARAFVEKRQPQFSGQP